MIDSDPPPTSRTAVAFEVPAFHRERVVVRRRRPRDRRRGVEWSARSSRARTIRTVAVSVGILLLMAASLYMGLSRQEMSPAEGHRRPTTVAAHIVHG